MNEPTEAVGVGVPVVHAPSDVPVPVISPAESAFRRVTPPVTSEIESAAGKKIPVF